MAVSKKANSNLDFRSSLKTIYSGRMDTAESSSLERLGGRRFAFYPAIRNIEHNEWTLESETWSEILAKNAETSQEIWIPRAHLGDVSSVDEPVLILGLKRELEYKAGDVRPFRQTVVSIPAARGARPAEELAKAEPAAPKRSSSTTDSKTLSFIGRALAISVIAVLGFALFVSGNLPNPLAGLFRADSSTADQRYLGLTAKDGYYDVAAKVGPPESEQWLTQEQADLHFQVLDYPQRGYAVVMMGGSRGDVRYIGSLHQPSRKILDSARIGGGDTSSLLKNLPEF